MKASRFSEIWASAYVLRRVTTHNVSIWKAVAVVYSGSSTWIATQSYRSEFHPDTGEHMGRPCLINFIPYDCVGGGHAVALLFQALCYKPEGIFELANLFSRTMALGSTQPLAEMSTRNLPGSKGRPARKADNLTAICEPTVWKMWGPRRLRTLWASTACYRDSFTFTILLYDCIILSFRSSMW
jgi:hypothetical protein